jgi:threonine aldolase
MDGARIFNAAIATGVDARTIAETSETVTFCLSKGLSCPVGSLLCGPAAKVRQARRWRKMLGGGMRQAGVLAAAGLVALETMIDRLADDHANARALAEGLAQLPGVCCDLTRVQTNIVYFQLTRMDSAGFLAACSQRGLLGTGPSATQVRFVTHHGISGADIQRALAICQQVLTSA